MPALRALLLVILGVGIATADDTGTARHLLAGVRAFKDARYEDALVELRVVARAPDAPADLAFYLGPTLYKLGRYREALGVFVGSHAAPDALTDFYLGETYYQLQLYRKARAVFAGLRTRGLGPVLGDAADRYVAAIDGAPKPTDGTIDFYIAQAREVAAHDPAVAGEYFDEARLLDTPPHHRHDEITMGLGAAWNAAGRSRAVVDALGGDRKLAPEATWELARAYAALGDARARPLLDAVAKGRGPHAADAAALLAKLAP